MIYLCTKNDSLGACEKIEFVILYRVDSDKVLKKKERARVKMFFNGKQVEASNFEKRQGTYIISDYQ